tara:strand:- start:70 stop:714 length:645 start_codon:yes stop_codon:yes gene_type:complete
MSQLNVDTIVSRTGGSPTFSQGAVVTGVVTATTGSFSGNVSVGGTLTYEDVTNIDSVGLITARSGISVTGGNTSIKGAVETAATGSYSGTVLTCDTETATVFTHDLQSGAVGIVSITNFPASSASFHTVTLLLRQNDTGTAHTVAAAGIQTVTLTPTGVAGNTFTPLVGGATTVTLSANANAENFVTIGIHYNGGTNTSASSYKVFITNNGDFR